MSPLSPTGSLKLAKLAKANLISLLQFDRQVLVMCFFCEAVGSTWAEVWPSALAFLPRVPVQAPGNEC